MKSIIKIALFVLIFMTTQSCAQASKRQETKQPQQKAEAKKQEKETKVQMETTLGTITIKLYNETPLHRDNFIKLVNDGFYNGLLFHRVIPNFMIQGGDPDSRNAQPGQQLGAGNIGYTIPAEFVFPKRYHKRGALAAARTGDQVNPQRASSGSQFYIVTGNIFSDADLNNMERRQGITFTAEQRQTYRTIGGTPFLDNEYTVFGEVIDGMEVVDKISAVRRAPGDRPIEDVKIISAKILK